MMNREIPIFFTIDDSYAPFLAVALNSAIKNSDPQRNYKAIVLYQDLGADNISRLQSLQIETIIKDLSAMGLKNGKVSIAHCQNEEGALKLKDLIAEKFKNAQVEIHKLRGLCSFYAEKGGFLVGFEKM